MFKATRNQLADGTKGLHPVNRRRRLMLAPLLALGILVPASAASAAVVYDNVPSPMPGNVVSQAFEATSTSEFGGQIKLANTERQDPSITVTMSSWGCQNRPAGVCTTTPGATFSHPITLNLYSVLPNGEPGGQIASVTKTFNIPYRPSANPAVCGDGRWSQDGTAATCFNGFANNITFDLSGHGISLPDRVIVALAYPTSHYGKPALGTQPCTGTPQGCGYDSLNVGLTGPPTVGSLPRVDDAYIDSTWTGAYCDNGVAGTNELRLDPGCWFDGTAGAGNMQPAIEVNATQTSGAQGHQGQTGASGATGATGPAGAVASVVASSKKKCKASKKLGARRKCKTKRK